jgi:hypothetical protein
LIFSLLELPEPEPLDPIGAFVPVGEDNRLEPKRSGSDVFSEADRSKEGEEIRKACF